MIHLGDLAVRGGRRPHPDRAAVGRPAWPGAIALLLSAKGKEILLRDPKTGIVEVVEAWSSGSQ